MRNQPCGSLLPLLVLAVAVNVMGAGAVLAWNDYWLPTEGYEANRVLVPGTPPLTMGARNTFFNCVEFGLSLAMTEAEKEQAQIALMQEYLVFKGQLLDDLKGIGGIWQQLLQAAPEDRGTFRAIIREALFEEVEKHPDLGISKVLRTVLKDSETVLIPGSPPLSKRSLAAFFEILEMASKFRDKRVVAWNDQTRMRMEAALLARFPSLAPDARRWLGNADLHGALLVRNWNKTPAEEKNLIRGFIADTFAPPGKDSGLPIDVDQILLPPPTIFPLPGELPWPMR